MSMPMPRSNLPEHQNTRSPEHPLIQCEARAARLDGGPGMVGVGQPKPYVYMSPAEIRLRRERWIFNC